MPYRARWRGAELAEKHYPAEMSEEGIRQEAAADDHRPDDPNLMGEWTMYFVVGYQWFRDAAAKIAYHAMED